MAEKWEKPDPALVERFIRALPEHPDVEHRKMFGYPAPVSLAA